MYISKHDIWLNGYNKLLDEMQSIGPLSNFTKKHESYDWLRVQRRRWEKLDEEKRMLLMQLGWEDYMKQLGERKKKPA